MLHLPRNNSIFLKKDGVIFFLISIGEGDIVGDTWKVSKGI